MKTIPVNAIMLSYKLQKYFQSLNPGKKIEYYCWSEEYEGKEDWDGYVPKYYRMDGMMIITEKITVLGDTETSIEKKALNERQILKDITNMYNDYFRNNDIDLKVNAIYPHEKIIDIELKEITKDKQLFKKMKEC